MEQSTVNPNLQSSLAWGNIGFISPSQKGSLPASAPTFLDPLTLNSSLVSICRLTSRHLVLSALSITTTGKL